MRPLHEPLHSKGPDTKLVHIEYPRVANLPEEPPRAHAIQIQLVDVRAADDLRVSYDFDRDGWKVEQEHIEACDGFFKSNGVWEEVAFVPAWGKTTRT